MTGLTTYIYCQNTSDDIAIQAHMLKCNMNLRTLFNLKSQKILLYSSLKLFELPGLCTRWVWLVRLTCCSRCPLHQMICHMEYLQKLNTQSSERRCYVMKMLRRIKVTLLHICRGWWSWGDYIKSSSQILSSAGFQNIKQNSNNQPQVRKLFHSNFTNDIRNQLDDI